MEDFQFFDPKQEHTIVWKALPHWTQVGTVCFITWRTSDSLPKGVLSKLAEERRQLLRTAGIDGDRDWRRGLAKLPIAERSRMRWSLFAVWDKALDRGAGECVLASPELSRIVADSLLHFDGDRYSLTDFIVMPNHVHVLVAFRAEEMLLKQCRSWKRFTSGEIQKFLGRQGEFWQVDQFDHLVRSEEDFWRYRRYIAENAVKAHLPAGSYRHYSKDLS